MILMFNEVNNMSIVNLIESPFLLKLEGISFEINKNKELLFYSLTAKKKCNLEEAIQKKLITRRNQKIQIIQQIAEAI
jgi:hypothetical protein